METQCLRRNDEPLERLTAMRQTPEGAQKVAIYTDEHGIGDVNFEPGSGFWFNALMNTQPDLDNNANGGCDLKYLKDNVLGTADITADARYPNQPVNGGDPAGSATIHKTVKSLFAKYLAVYPKGSTPDLRNARIVVAHAQDIDGSPFAREVVCFVNTTKGNDGVTPFIPTDQNQQAEVIGPYDVSGTSRSTTRTTAATASGSASGPTTTATPRSRSRRARATRSTSSGTSRPRASSAT